MVDATVFTNGSKIMSIDSCGNTRGNRSMVISWFDKEMGYFVKYDGNKPIGEQFSYFILDEDDNRIYVNLEENENG